MSKLKVGGALLSSMFSFGLFAMGMGDIKVSSFLNQPFNADIELIDVGNTPLSEIKASLASPEDFERVGLERSYSLGLLTLRVEKHSNGKAFIKVSSVEGITDPFMQLLVDLAWADGQVYRSYTVLLDPPNYELTMVKAQLHKIIKQQSGVNEKEPGVIDKTVYSTVERMPGKSTSDSQGLIVYGPTLPNETIWQISQRYKSDDFLLQQMILAMVGINPEAFTDGNLNGLKDGSRLKIPDSRMVHRVSSELSVSEVFAHDKAWQTKGPIEHTLIPPYIGTSAPEDMTTSVSTNLSSYLPVIPLQATGLPSHQSADSVPLFTTFSSFISGETPGASEAKIDTNDTVLAKEIKLKSDIDIAAAAINSIRQSNGLLVEQLKLMKTSNQRLQKELMESKRSIKRLQHKIHKLMLQKQTTVQGAQPLTQEEKKRIFPWIIALFELSIFIGLLSLWLWNRFKLKSAAFDVSSLTDITPTSEPVVAPFFENNRAVPEPLKNAGYNEVVPSDVPESKDAVSPQIVEEKNIKTDEALLEGEVSLIKPDVEIEPAEAINPPESVSFVNEPVINLEDSKPGDTKESTDEDFLIEFEPGIKEVVVEEGHPKTPEVTDKMDGGSIDFILNPVEEISSIETSSPVKSGAALDTLLDLGKTYIGMDDIEAARQSLQEVLEFGNEAQKKEAKQLMDDLNKKQ